MSKLKELEGMIAEAFLVEAKAGANVREIRDKKLFRENYPDIYAYCDDKLDLDREGVDRLIRLANKYFPINGEENNNAR